MPYKLILWNILDGLRLVDNHSYTACTSSFIASAFSYLMVISGCLNNGLLSPPIATGVTANLSSLQDSLSNLERVLNTPLPFAYQVHLRMSVWYVFLKDLARGTCLNALTFLGYTSFSCLCAIPLASPYVFSLPIMGRSKYRKLLGMWPSQQPPLLPSYSLVSLKLVKKCELFSFWWLYRVFLNMLFQWEPLQLRSQWSWYGLALRHIYTRCGIDMTC